MDIIIDNNAKTTNKILIISLSNLDYIVGSYYSNILCNPYKCYTWAIAFSSYSNIPSYGRSTEL